MKLHIMVSRHSAFYSPLIAAVPLLEQRGVTVEYSVLIPGQRSAELVGSGAVDIMQSAVSSNWKPMERGESPLPVHFAQINRRDGFFIVARTPEPAFEWKHLEGRHFVADHGLQPMAMLRYAAAANGVDWERVECVDAGDPGEMERKFRNGTGDYVHLQSPAAHSLGRDGVGHVVASVGASMPEVAFSSLCCSRPFLATPRWQLFMDAYRESRHWVRSVDPAAVADCERPFFPDVSRDSLAGAIAAYQKLGCWEGGTEIPRSLYEQALTVFESGGLISHRYPYEEVCAATP